MANILIYDLRPTGSDLFDSSESYLQEISDFELSETNGGISPLVAFAIGFGIGYVIGRYAT
jgi:hypothetical protein